MFFLSKLFLLTTLVFTQAARTPVGDHPFDYEFAGAASAKITQLANASIYTRLLWEREEGRYGSGHDIRFSYTAKSLLFPLPHTRTFSSYYRQVKDMSLQTIDTAYSLFKIIGVGYSLSFYDFSNTQLLAYGKVDLKYISYEVRLNPHTTITKIKAEYAKRKKTGITPFISFEYLHTGRAVDWQQKIGIRIKFPNKKKGEN